MERKGDRVSKQRWRASERVIGRAWQTVVQWKEERERKREKRQWGGKR